MANPRSKLVKELYAAALALEGEARRRYLDEHCPDATIRREVEKLCAVEPTRTIMTFAVDSLAPGSVLGHYRIQQGLGAGGMGLVYEALDQKLNRPVAVKVLPPGNVDEDTRRRFIREAQAASALNHPNIVTVYEVGREGDTDFIVMERVSGQTLHQTIAEKGLDVRTTIRYAAQIAGALAAAHEAGIVHRDLKPGNVMVTERGLVKVLDFGLAKQNKPPEDGAVDAPLTRAGQVVGTFSYVSPEQAQGQAVDARSDIFSFGSVVYEMLTGARAFREDSSIATLAAVLHKEPAPLRQLAPTVPKDLERLIGKCLQKKPHDRWQHMLDVKQVLEDLLTDLDAPPAAPVTGRRRAGWLPLAAALAGMLVTAVVFRFLGPAPAASEPEPVYRMLTVDSGLNDYPALSRDGKFVAFASDRSGAQNLDIWLQQIGGSEPIRLTTDPADETAPAFSPDGTRIAFRSEKNGGGIYVVPSLGGDPVLLAPGGRNPRFSPDGRWVAYWTGRGEGSLAAGSSQVFVVEAGGGQPRQIQPEMASAKYPAWSPGGDSLLVLGWQNSSSQEDWWVLPVDRGAPRKTRALLHLKAQRLTEVQLGLRVERAPLEWLDRSGGTVLFAAPLGDSANLWEIGLSPSGAVSGPARRVTRGPGRQAHAAWAMAGESERLAFSDQTVNYDVWTLPVDPERGTARGEMTRVTDSVATEWAPSITQDGRQLLYVGRREGRWALLLKETENGRERILFSSTGLLANAQITGDGRRVVFSDAEFNILSIPTGGGTVTRLCERCGTVLGVSSDGRFVTYEPIDNEDVLVLDTKERKSDKLALRPGQDVLSGSRISPDGKWVAFHSIHYPAGTTQIWIAPVDFARPAPPESWIPITDGQTFAQEPCWSANGNILYFVSERDGFRCFWGQRLDPATKRPAGEPFPLRHFHSARQTLRGAASTGYLTGLVTGAGQMVFALAELKGSIWLQESARGK